MSRQADRLTLLQFTAIVWFSLIFLQFATATSTDGAFQNAMQALAAGDVQRANATFHMVLRKDPRHMHSLIQLFWLACKAGDTEGAQKLESRLLALHPDSAQVRGMLSAGWRDVRFEYTEKAVEYSQAFLRASTSKQNEVSTLVNLAYLLAELDREEEAEAALRRALLLQPDSIDVRVELALFLMSSFPGWQTAAHSSSASFDARLAQAEQLLPAALTDMPSHTLAQLRLAEIVFARCSDAQASSSDGDSLEQCMASAHLSAGLRSDSSRDVPNDYAGFVVPDDPSWRVHRFVVPSLYEENSDSSKANWREELASLFEAHRQRREPLIISKNPNTASQPSVPTYTALSRIAWTVAEWRSVGSADQPFGYLREKAGNDLVYAFRRHHPRLSWGSRLSMRRMTFNTFLDAVQHERTQSRNNNTKNDVEAAAAECEAGNDDKTTARLQTPETTAHTAEHYLTLQHKPGLVYQPPLNAALQRDVPVPSFLANRTITQINLWMGHSRNAVRQNTDTQAQTRDLDADYSFASGLHFDSSDNLVGVVQGQKRYLLFSPADAVNLYPLGSVQKITANGTILTAVHSSINHFCLVDPDHPDYARFPRFEQARAVEVWLNEGEMLFLPAFWAHHVRSFGDHIAVNHWFRM